jgi:hypothetical protein
MVLMTACWGYYLWDRNKKAEAVITWVKEQGGTVSESHPKWIDKWPLFTQGALKGIAQSYYEISLLYTKVIDISALKNLTNLKELDLSDTAVIDISALKNLTNLQELDITDTEVSKEQIEELQKKLPKLDIRYSHTHD